MAESPDDGVQTISEEELHKEIDNAQKDLETLFNESTVFQKLFALDLVGRHLSKLAGKYMTHYLQENWDVHNLPLVLHASIAAAEQATGAYEVEPPKLRDILLNETIPILDALSQNSTKEPDSKIITDV